MIYYFYMALSIILTGIGQIMLKMGAKNGKTLMSTYINPITVAGYILFLIVTVSSIYALKGIELKTFYVLASLNYLVVVFLSMIILKEKISKNMALSLCLIIIGVITFNL